MENFKTTQLPSFIVSDDSSRSLSTASTISELEKSHPTESPQSLKLNQISGNINIEDIYYDFGSLGLMIWSSVEYLPKFKKISTSQELLLGLIEYRLEGISDRSSCPGSLGLISSLMPSVETLINYIYVENSMEASLFMVIIGILYEHQLRINTNSHKEEVQDMINQFLTVTPSWVIQDASQILGLSSLL
jgi:hypothetical protein